MTDITASICIASYNMVDTIEESLQTITEELPEDYEIVVVNQSVDGSEEVIDRIASESELPFKTIHTDLPLGVGHARNLAVCKATGDVVVTHVDADDWYDSRFFPAFVDLYRRIKKNRETDFFFSCPNMNISSREYMLDEYLLSSLPIGANEKEYRWRAYKNDDYIRVTIDSEVSGRIKLSDRKTITSRIKRTHLRHIGMYKTGYSSRRILKEDVLYRDWPLYSQIFRVAILPLAWLQSLIGTTICDSPVEGKLLPEVLEECTYTLAELREMYELHDELLIDNIVK